MLHTAQWIWQLRLDWTLLNMILVGPETYFNMDKVLMKSGETEVHYVESSMIGEGDKQGNSYV